jgi:hypothetical protein
VGNREMSWPVLAARAKPGLMPGISASLATTGSATASGPVPAPGPVVPSPSTPRRRAAPQSDQLTDGDGRR